MTPGLWLGVVVVLEERMGWTFGQPGILVADALHAPVWVNLHAEGLAHLTDAQSDVGRGQQVEHNAITLLGALADTREADEVYEDFEGAALRDG
jgi:hypothetical protein